MRGRNATGRIIRRPPLYLLSLLLLCLPVGCGGLHDGDYGRIVPDGGVQQTFESYQPDPDFNYYISGSDAQPNAILGINKDYILESTLWKRIEMTPRVLRDLVTHMKIGAPIIHGFVLLNHAGDRIGVWYSILSATTWFRMTGNHTIVVATPELHTYEKRERWSPERMR